MTQLWVRHAQASYGAANYDQLSALGWTQAAALGRYLAAQTTFGAVRVGTMRRHQETLSAIKAAYDAAGVALPEPTVDAGLDEFDHGAVIRRYLDEHADAPMRDRAASKDPAIVGPMLHAAITAWADDRLSALPETWLAFGERVATATRAAAAVDGPVLVVTSGGVISRVTQQALDVPASRAVDLNLAIRNTALNEFSVRQARLRFGSFNTLPHLAHDRALWTHF